MMNCWIIKLWDRRSQLSSEGFLTNDSTTRESDRVMTMLAFIGSYYDSGIVWWAFHPFLYSAFAICAAVVAPATVKTSTVMLKVWLAFITLNFYLLIGVSKKKKKGCISHFQSVRCEKRNTRHACMITRQIFCNAHLLHNEKC